MPERDSVLMSASLIRAAELPGTDDALLAEHGWTWRLGMWVYRDRLSMHVRRLDPWPDGRPAGWAPSRNDGGNCATAYEAMGRIAAWGGGGSADRPACMHDNCTNCHGTGRRPNGTACVHAMSCPCPKCRPAAMGG